MNGKKKMTNADVIRQISDEDLRDFLTTWENGGFASDYLVAFCDLCEREGGNTLGLYCDGCILHWLKRDSNDTGGLSFSFKTKRLVETIPVEWIEKWLRENGFKNISLCTALEIEQMVEDWRKENE